MKVLSIQHVVQFEFEAHEVSDGRKRIWTVTCPVHEAMRTYGFGQGLTMHRYLAQIVQLAEQGATDELAALGVVVRPEPEAAPSMFDRRES